MIVTNTEPFLGIEKELLSPLVAVYRCVVGDIDRPSRTRSCHLYATTRALEMYKICLNKYKKMALEALASNLKIIQIIIWMLIL